MRCLEPRSIKNPKINADNIHDKSIPLYIDVPCGKCLHCKMNQHHEWVFRIGQEMKVARSCYFITLTYDETELPHINSPDGPVPTLDKRDVQLFLKRLRKAYPEQGIRYFLCGEYGEVGHRPHYHIIMFNAQVGTNFESYWDKGIVYVDSDLSGAAFMYVTAYMEKGSEKPSVYSAKPFHTQSQGLGKNYLSDSIRQYHEQNNIRCCTLPGGIKTPMPRYYKRLIDLPDYVGELKTLPQEMQEKGKDLERIKRNLMDKHERKKLKLKQQKGKL